MQQQNLGDKFTAYFHLSLSLIIFILDPQASISSPNSSVNSHSFSHWASKTSQQRGKKWIHRVFSNKSQGQIMS